MAKKDSNSVELESVQSVENGPQLVDSGHLDKYPTLNQKSVSTAYFEPAWHREFDKSLVDTSLYVPIVKQVASLLSDSSDNGILAGASKVLKEDYVFADGKIPHGVSLKTITAFDNVDDIAEVYEFNDTLKKQVKDIMAKLKDAESLKWLNELTAKIDAGETLTSDDVGKLKEFGVTLDNNTESK